MKGLSNWLINSHFQYNDNELKGRVREGIKPMYLKFRNKALNKFESIEVPVRERAKPQALKERIVKKCRWIEILKSMKELSDKNLNFRNRVVFFFIRTEELRGQSQKG